MEQHSNHRFHRSWENNQFNRKDCVEFSKFLTTKLKCEMNDDPCIKNSKIKASLEANTRANRLKKSLVGCHGFCPFCKTKCQAPVAGACRQHHSNFHLLQAFNGITMNNENATQILPCIDICNSQSNMKSYWIYNTSASAALRLVSDKLVRYKWEDVCAHHVHKNPMEYNWKINKGLDEDFAVKLLDMYFNKGLQNKILTKQRNLKNCVKADKTKDILFGDEIRFENDSQYGVRKQRNKSVDP